MLTIKKSATHGAGKQAKIVHAVTSEVPFEGSVEAAPVSGGSALLYKPTAVVSMQQDSDLPDTLVAEIARLEQLEPKAALNIAKMKKLKQAVDGFKDDLKALGENLTAFFTNKGIDSDKEEIVHGASKDLRVSKMGTERTINDMEKLLIALQTKLGEEAGEELFMKITTATWTEIDKYLTRAEQVSFTNTKRTPRTVTFIEKMNP